MPIPVSFGEQNTACLLVSEVREAEKSLFLVRKFSGVRGGQVDPIWLSSPLVATGRKITAQ